MRIKDRESKQRMFKKLSVKFETQPGKDEICVNDNTENTQD